MKDFNDIFQMNSDFFTSFFFSFFVVFFTIQPQAKWNVSLENSVEKEVRRSCCVKKRKSEKWIYEIIKPRGIWLRRKVEEFFTFQTTNIYTQKQQMVYGVKENIPFYILTQTSYFPFMKMRWKFAFNFN
jgi:hypothetical protein